MKLEIFLIHNYEDAAALGKDAVAINGIIHINFFFLCKTLTEACGMNVVLVL